MSGKDPIPFIPASSKMPELTWRAVILGSLLGVLLTAANTYLGLYTGLTVSSSIPAAVISMALLRGILKRGTILENNIVQTIAASGESLAAGIIFTVPALLITGLWNEIKFWPTTLICISGGLLGICFMIPLRRSHIVEDKTLTFPESVACSEVLKAGDRGGVGARYVFIAVIVGALFKFFSAGLSLFRGTVEWALRAREIPTYFGFDVSAALLAVGYIVGPNISSLAFMGGCTAWMIAIPLHCGPVPSEGLMEWFHTMWREQARFLGVGAMIVGGIWSLFRIRNTISTGINEAILGYRRGGREPRIRTETNMNPRHVLLLLVIAVLTTFILYWVMIGNFATTLVATASMFVMSFFFVAVSSYISGLVGVSNSPISGMTICAVMGTAGLLLLFGMTGEKGVIATLVVAGVVCCAAVSAGDMSQDLKTGYIIGATPKTQQWMEVLGAAIPAVVITPILIVLQRAYGIGTDAAGSLKAPQANLFAHLVEGMFGQRTLPWNFVLIGVCIGVALVIIDEVLAAKKATFRVPVLPVALGMYLPFSVSASMFVGGLIAGSIRNKSDSGTGVLFASGLIAGEALVGVMIAAAIYIKGSPLPVVLVDSDIVSCAGFFILGSVLYIVAKTKG